MAVDGGAGGRIINMGGTSIPDWAMLASPQSDNAFLTMVLTLIQLLGIVGIGNGIRQLLAYYNPSARNPPENLGKAFMMIIFGMFALVPTRVYNLFLDFTALVGWS